MEIKFDKLIIGKQSELLVQYKRNVCQKLHKDYKKSSNKVDLLLLDLIQSKRRKNAFSRTRNAQASLHYNQVTSWEILLSKACRNSSWSAWICSIFGFFTEFIIADEAGYTAPLALQLAPLITWAEFCNWSKNKKRTALKIWTLWRDNWWHNTLA